MPNSSPLTTRVALLLLLLVPLAILGPGMLPGKVIADHGTELVLPFSAVYEGPEGLPQANADIVRENLVYRHIVRESLLDGEIPWWEPTMYGGTPFVAMNHTQVLYPLTWLTLPLSPTAAHNWLIYFHVVLAGVGTFVWLRAAGRTREAAFVGGLTFLLNGMFATRHGHPQYVAVGAWLPWMLVAVEHLFGPRRFLATIGLAGVTAMMILAGHPSIYVFGSYFVGLYLLGRAWMEGPTQRRRAVQGLGLFTLGYATGLFLASIQFLAIAEYSQYSARSVRSLSGLKSRLPNWIHIFRILFANLTGTMIDGSYWSPKPYSHYWANTLYNGVVPAFLAIVAVVRAPRRAGWMAGLMLGVALVLFWPVAFSAAYYLPGFSFGRVDRLSIAWFLGFAWMAALGFDTLVASKPRMRGTLGLAGFGVLAAVLAVPAVSRLADRAVDVSPTWSVGTAQWAVLWGLGLWLVIAAVVAFRDRLGTRAFLGAVLVLVLVDLGGWWREWAVVRDADQLFPSTETTDFLTAQEGDFRIAKYLSDQPKVGLFPVFPANLPAVYGIEDIHGFGPLHLKAVDRLLLEAEPGRIPHGWHTRPFSHEGSLDTPILDLMNVRYIVSSEPLESLPLAHEGELLVYENPGAFERAWFVREWAKSANWKLAALQLGSRSVDASTRVLLDGSPDVAKSLPETGETGVAMVSRSRNELVLDKTGPDAGFVVLAESWYPGWTAEVDGVTTEIYLANVMHRAVFVEAGDHRIVMRYRPWFWPFSAGLMALGLAIIGGLALADRRRERVV